MWAQDGAQGGSVGVSSVDFSYTTLFQLCENRMMFFFFVTKIKRKKKRNKKRAQSASSFTWSRVTISKKKKAEHKGMQYQRRVRVARRAAADILNDDSKEKNLPPN